MELLHLELDENLTRAETRKEVVSTFLKENPGTGTGDLASKYNYIVFEKNNLKVLLQRPANLKNGFDFLIRLDGYLFNKDGERKRDYPKHEEIIDDLLEKKAENSEMYKKYFEIINKIFNSEIVHEKDMFEINFNSGLDAETILHIIKWFFIEQDIRYWNYSGRNMLMSGIPLP